VRPFVAVRGFVATPRADPTSKVMSWSMNWPMNVVPAVWAGLFGLFALRLGSTIKSTGPRSRASAASSRPPGRPISRRAASSEGLASANGGRSNIRLKRSERGDGGRARAAPGPRTVLTPAAAAPAPNPPMNCRRVILVLRRLSDRIFITPPSAKSRHVLSSPSLARPIERCPSPIAHRAGDDQTRSDSRWRRSSQPSKGTGSA
jgi:hypothetical protein